MQKAFSRTSQKTSEVFKMGVVTLAALPALTVDRLTKFHFHFQLSLKCLRPRCGMGSGTSSTV